MVVSERRHTRPSVSEESWAAIVPRGTFPRCVESARAANEIPARPLGRHNRAGIQTGVLPPAGYRLGGPTRRLARRPLQ